MITIDPNRDTAKVLKEYMKCFNNNFIGLTGKANEIDDIVKHYNGFNSYSADTTSESYTVDHTSNLYLLNPQGEVANIISYGLPVTVISDNIKKLLAQSDP